ncbi:MAG: flagellar hook-length control protein FliK, partial [Verrucomicrobiae bacterium]|nr:flagellar hook-length control protein FliK [Verrucomicrobiae bacterium]
AITSGEGDILQGKDQEPMKVRTLSIAETLTKTPNKSGKEESINARLETPQLKNTSPVNTTREGELPQGKSNGQEQAQARTISTNEMLKNPETKTGREESITSRVETSQVKIQVEDQRGESSGDNSKSRSDDGKSENRKATVRPFDLRFGTGTNNLESQKQATASPNRLGQINSAVQLGKDAASEDSTPDSAKRITSEEAASKVTLSLGNTRMDSGLNARPVQVQTVFARIASGVEQMKQDQLNSVHLRLTLDSGESVRIHLRMRGQSLRTVILTDSDGLRSAFKEGWESFSRSLLAKGVNADGLQFSMSDKEGGKSSAQDQWEDRDLRNNDLAGLTSTSVAGAPAPKHESPLQLRPIPATESRTRFTRFA